MAGRYGAILQLQKFGVEHGDYNRFQESYSEFPLPDNQFWVLEYALTLVKKYCTWVAPNGEQDIKLTGFELHVSSFQYNGVVSNDTQSFCRPQVATFYTSNLEI